MAERFKENRVGCEIQGVVEDREMRLVVVAREDIQGSQVWRRGRYWAEVDDGEAVRDWRHLVRS